MLMKMKRTGGIAPIDDLVMDPGEGYNDFKTRMQTFFYCTNTFVSKKKMEGIYGIVNRARKHGLAMRIDIVYDDADYSNPLNINGESLQIFHYQPPMGFVLHRLLKCKDNHQAERVVKRDLDTREKLDDFIALLGLVKLESDTKEGKRRRIVDNCVGAVGPKVWFTEFVNRVYKQ